MRCLVTGGCGFVGRHIVRWLLEDGHDVVSVDPLRPGTGAVSAVSWPLFSPWAFDERFHCIGSDVRSFLMEHGDLQRFDLVVHCAAVVGGRATIEGDPLAVADCLSIDAAVLRWAVRSCVGTLIYMSSSAVYPLWRQDGSVTQPMHEYLISLEEITCQTQPDHIYGWAKLTGERLVVEARRAGLRVAVYRPFSGYGEDQSAGYPMIDICQRALDLREGEVMSVWGSGRQVRDWVHIDDVVRWIAQTWERIAESEEPLNLCSGEGTTMLQLADRAVRLSHPDRDLAPVVGTLSMPSGVMRRVGDPERLHMMGCVQTVPLGDGVQRVVDYLRSRR